MGTILLICMPRALASARHRSHAVPSHRSDTAPSPHQYAEVTRISQNQPEFLPGAALQMPPHQLAKRLQPGPQAAAWSCGAGPSAIQPRASTCNAQTHAATAPFGHGSRPSRAAYRFFARLFAHRPRIFAHRPRKAAEKPRLKPRTQASTTIHLLNVHTAHTASTALASSVKALEATFS